jgi:hypothetical protein
MGYTKNESEQPKNKVIVSRWTKGNQVCEACHWCDWNTAKKVARWQYNS